MRRDSLDIQSSDPDFTLCRMCDVLLVHDEDTFWKCPQCGHVVNRWWDRSKYELKEGERFCESCKCHGIFTLMKKEIWEEYDRTNNDEKWGYEYKCPICGRIDK